MNAKPFNESKQSQDDYCRDCVHADSCNVMLKDGEECGDRYEQPNAELIKFQERNAERNTQSMVEVDSRQADLEAADFDRQVLETLAHWPGIEAVDLDA
jgi:hypothetical protein